MTDRTIFNRTYTAYTPQGQTVYLVNGGLKATASGFNPTIDIIAGENMAQGTPVYVSGTKCFPAHAAASVQNFEINVVGFTDEPATINAPVTVDLDGVVSIVSSQITGEGALTPGKYYYLSEYRGEIVQNASPSGTVSKPDYKASAPLGVAVTTTALTIEIATPTFLV